MATATEYASPPGFSRSSSLSVTRSPDLASPIFPDRGIRPLPKSRLKSKLSPQQASSIDYPPDPPPISPTLMKFSGQDNGAVPRMTNGEVPTAHGHYLHRRPHSHQEAHSYNHCTCDDDIIDSGDEEVEFDHPDFRYAAPTATNGAGQGGKVLDNVQRRLMEAARIPAKPPKPGSAASSADGYESFENTSNKKKRKIPLSTASGMHQSQLSAEMASMGISGSLDGAVDDGHVRGGGVVGVQQHYPLPSSGSAGAGTGISGAGRGRYGRQNGRSDNGIRRPLGSSSVNSVNAYGPRVPAKGMMEVKDGDDTDIENTGGIISQAIKTAAEQGPLTPRKGPQDNSSLLQSATTSKDYTPGTNETQFTFPKEYESAIRFPEQHVPQASYASYNTPSAPNTRGVNGQAPHGGGSKSNAMSTPAPPPNRGTNNGVGNANPAARPAPNPQLPPTPRRHRRRRPSQEFALAARQRRLQQESTNFHHRGKENMWICEFCEYEDIFGVPPVALIRQFEIKDKRERKARAEKQRLLEKAKGKGRKGGKKKGKGNGGGGGGGGVVGGNGNATTSLAGNQQGGVYDPDLGPPSPSHEQVLDGEYFDDEEEFADEYDPVGPDDDGEGFEQEYYRPPPPAVPQQAPHGPGGGGGKRGG